MKVGYVIKSYPRLSQTFIVNEVLAHEAAGLDLEIFSLRPPRDEDRHGSVARVKAPVLYLPHLEGTASAFWHEAVELARLIPQLWPRLGAAAASPASEVFQGLALARLARERGVTHLHAHFGNVATAVARLAGHFAALPYSFTAHARDIFHDKVVPAELERKLAEAQAVVTVSDYNLNFLNRNYGPAAQTVRRIYNGLDLSRFNYSVPTRRESLIVSVGRLIDKKGFEDLIDACALLKARGREFVCRIIGSGPLEEELKARILRLGMERDVQMLGSLPQEEVVRQMQAAAAFAAPCVVGPDGDRDGLPTVLLEAMALGTPCVSTDVTGIPEILRDEATGLMVGQHDATALAGALDRLLEDAPLRQRLADGARRLMETQFDIHENTARMRKLFGGAIC